MKKLFIIPMILLVMGCVTTQKPCPSTEIIIPTQEHDNAIPKFYKIPAGSLDDPDNYMNMDQWNEFIRLLNEAASDPCGDGDCS